MRGLIQTQKQVRKFMNFLPESQYSIKLGQLDKLQRKLKKLT